MRSKLVCVLLVATLLLTGCWDRIELEDQLFISTIAIDKGERHAYRVSFRVPVAGEQRSGILGGRASGAPPFQLISAEADTVVQAMYVLNASVARRMTLRHLRGIIVGENLARDGLHSLLAELWRNGDVKATAGFWVARGSATEALGRARPTGEVNPGKINEGLLLVEKGLHMAPPIRLQDMLDRRGEIGIDPLAPVIGINRRVLGERVSAHRESAVAGDLDRVDGNPVEIAGTAVFRDTKLAGFLTVDETQALLAMQGEMGKAYITMPDPFKSGKHMTIRFQQENLPQYRASFGPNGPQVTIRLLFEGEVLTGDATYTDQRVRRQLENAASDFMEQTILGVVSKLRDWEADPVGLGLKFRKGFPTWAAWERYGWRNHIRKLDVRVTSVMRIRRFGLLHEGPKAVGGGEE